MVALASAFLGDDTELSDRLAALSHGEVVALALELADGSAWARQAIWLSWTPEDLDESPQLVGDERCGGGTVAVGSDQLGDVAFGEAVTQAP